MNINNVMMMVLEVVMIMLTMKEDKSDDDGEGDHNGDTIEIGDKVGRLNMHEHQ